MNGYTDFDAISFPYPKQGKVIRMNGQGCMSCVHQGYCPAFYWLLRKNDRAILTNSTGVACEKWSANVNDRVLTVSENDRKINDRLNMMGALREKEDSGMTDPISCGPSQFDSSGNI